MAASDREAQDRGEEDDGFPAKQLATLAICRLAEPIAFTSILAYTFVMVKGFQGGDDTNASFYAGLLVSAFAVAEACTAMTWGTISDHYGRKPIILIGLAGTALSSLVFGFAKNFWVALAARVIGGLLNGNVAVMQTMVAEICTKPEYEPRGYAMPAFMWSLGTIVGGSMGGYLAEPTKYYPTMFAPDGLFGEYPYLLPNLVAVGFIIVAIIQGYFFLKETNPRIRSSRSQLPPNQDQDGHQDETPDECTPLRPAKRRRSVMEDISVGERRPSFISGSMPTMTEPSFSLRRGSVTTLYSVHSLTPRTPEVFYDTEDEIAPTPTKIFNRAVLLWILAVVIMCYHQMAFSSLLPIYLLDTPTAHHIASIDFKGGLGYTVHDVGAFMSINGVGALIIQGTIFPVFVGKVGVWRSLFMLIILCPTTYILVPFISLLTPTTRQFGIYAVLLLQNFFMIIIYPCLLIGLKNATPSPLVLGRVNGLAMSACSGARTIAPPLIGIIYGSGGSAAAWWSVAAVAGMGIIQLYWLPRPKDDADVVVENVFRKASEESLVRNHEGDES